MQRWARSIAGALSTWFEHHGRTMTWRGTRDPYAIWVSEIMLQQTRVDTVERYYAAFVERFPTVAALAAADEDAVLSAWSGLGYYRRARLLHQGAKFVTATHGGRVPRTPDALRQIPGLGPYTVGAISAIAFDQPVAAIDGNVARVLTRLRAVRELRDQPATAKGHQEWGAEILRSGSPRVLAQALMELGATVCLPKNPRCGECPVAKGCLAHAEGVVDLVPSPRVRAPVREERLWAVLALRGQNLLWQRRPSRGLLAGLWTPLFVPRQGTAQADVESVLGGRLRSLRELGAVEHVFTHRVWRATVVVGDAPARGFPEREDCRWVRVGDRPEGGIPSVAEKVLRHLEPRS